MSLPRKVTDTVHAFSAKASEWYGKMMAERFSIEMYQNCVDMLMESPIEHLFWIAVQALCESEYTAVNPDPLDGKPTRGVHIRQQARVGKYRVDFLLEQVGLGPDDVYTPIVVELDGHDFHDRDKTQRSYEKARDRFLVRQKLRVLHFTGSDVVADPFKVAHEALEMLGVFDGNGQVGYDKDDPLHMGF